MTRQRVRPSLYATQTAPCPTCGGSGRIFTPETVVRRMERAVRRAATEGKEKALVVRLHPEVALYVMEEEPAFARGMEKAMGVKLALRDDPLVAQDDFKLVTAGGHQDISARYNLG